MTAQFKNESAKAFVAGYQPSEVSVRKKGSDKPVPANCTIVSSKFEVAFQAPAKVNLPAYSEGAVPATMTCQVDGESYQQQINPINLSAKARNNSALGVGLLCPICGIGVAVGNTGEKTGDLFGFDKIELKISDQEATE